MSGILSRYIVTTRLHFSAVVLFHWVVFRLRKRKKYASFYLLGRFDCVLQIFHMLRYVLKKVGYILNIHLKFRKFQSQYSYKVYYACPKGTVYQDVFIYIKFYISMSRLDYTYQDLHTRKTRFQYTCQD